MRSLLCRVGLHRRAYHRVEIGSDGERTVYAVVPGGCKREGCDA